MSGLLVNKYEPNLSNKTHAFYSGSSSSTTYVVIVNITSGSGYINGLTGLNSANRQKLRITIDGVVIYDDYWIGSDSGSMARYMSLPTIIRFNKSCTVEVASSATNANLLTVGIAFD